MTITRIESFCVPPRWIFVRVETDTGLVGWGECILPRRVHAVLGALRDLSDAVKGVDADRITDLWSRMLRGGFFRGGPVLGTAAAGIEQALWDIKGRRLDAPVHALLGGKVRERVRAYAWIGGDRPQNVVDAVRERVRQGFTAVKMNATAELHYLDSPSAVAAAAERMAAVRRETGPDFGIAVDFHGRVHRAMAKPLLSALEPHSPLWIEEPLLSEHLDALDSVARVSRVLLATGERLYTRWDFKRVFEQRVVDIIQPDVSLTGLHELHTLARMAEAYDVTVAPHCPNGPISLAATLQVDAAVPNVVYQEYSLGLHYHTGYAGLARGELNDYVLNPEVLAVTDGWLSIPPGPGLGIEINEALVRERHHVWSLRDPNWRNADASAAEW
ncbi:MAG TPA: galactonate dehydratase [Opitutaceae bacterium]|nr:galactonate dehydratase [Opitutaceae bacterium]